MDFAAVKAGLEAKSFTLLDVRSPEEHQESRIPGAKNFPGKQDAESFEVTESFPCMTLYDLEHVLVF